MKTLRRYAATIIALLPLGTSAAQTPAAALQGSPSDQVQSIPFDQIGVEADKQANAGGNVIIPEADGARLRAVMQRLEGRATTEGLWLTSTADEDAGRANRFRVRAMAVGRAADTVTLPSTGAVRADKKTAVWLRPGLAEEYSVSSDGVRQDFVLPQRPAGEGDLTVKLEISGAKTEEAQQGAKLTVEATGREVAYHRLHVTDARGHTLPARMEVSSTNSLRVVVEDAGAAYPVRIDPTFSDSDWASMDSIGVPGVVGTVRAIARDSSGNLYIGGSFSLAGSTTASNVAKWDGSAWGALGSGVDGTVYALIASGSNVYVGGDFTVAGGGTVNRIAKWNGSAWSSLGTGVDNTVYALAISGSTVFAGGDFITAGGVTVNRIGAWNGSAWTAMGTGADNTVRALVVSSSDLYAGGYFSSMNNVAGSKGIAKYRINTGAWSSLTNSSGNGIGPHVNALTVSGGIVYAGGKDLIYWSFPLGVFDSVVKWNGSDWDGTFSGTTEVNSLAVISGTLYAGSGTGLRTHNGTTWSQFVTPSGAADVNVLLAAGTDLYMGGDFNVVGSKSANNFAKWNGSAWSSFGPLGLNGAVRAATISSGSLYIGGDFGSVGGVDALRVARWNGSAWSALGSGSAVKVLALAVIGSTVYAGVESFGSSDSRIIQWNNGSWSPVGTGITSLGTFVYALAAGGSDLYVGGSFSSAGGVSASNIAKWNGSSWSSVGSGTNGAVLALLANGGDLYAGGSFTNAGARSANRIAKWNGTNWSAMGGGFDNSVSALCLSLGNVFAGGSFTVADGIAVDRIARWNGTSWSPLGSGLDGRVLALAANGADVFVGGEFTTAGGLTVNRIARWNGGAWSAMGSGLTDGSSFALALMSSSTLHVAGDFRMAGSTESSFLAKANLSELTSAPEIDIYGKGASISSGDSSPDTSDGTDFGDVFTANGGAFRAFTIQNLGGAVLNFTATPRVSISGSHAADFSIITEPTSPTLNSGATTVIQIFFKPGADGLRTATVNIDSDDSDEPLYTFAIQGAGLPGAASILPARGTTAGGTEVTITGVGLAGPGFAGATGVTIGGASATNVTVLSNSVITCTTPPHAAGSASVDIITPTGTLTAIASYTYLTVTSLEVTNLNDSGTGSLRAAIDLANAAPGQVNITFTPGLNGVIPLSSMLPLIKNPIGVIIDGAGATVAIDGGSSSDTTGDRIFFFGVRESDNTGVPGSDSAHWAVSNLTLRNGNARGGAGGNGGTSTVAHLRGGGGGGGAGMGGAIFVNTGTMTLTNVALENNRAVGGAGGTNTGSLESTGGGGGMGGPGASAGFGGSGAGGGFGLSASRGSPGLWTGGLPGGKGLSSSGLPSGTGGASGGGGANGTACAGGGGPGGEDAFILNNNIRRGGKGAFGGGGGAAVVNTNARGGVGGYGGGGGGANGLVSGGGAGGFGGGGGGGLAPSPVKSFAGGTGSGDVIGGGGGAGLGGAVFVRQGASLIVLDGSVSGGTTSPGAAGGGSSTGGEAIGDGVFLAGSMNYVVSTGQTVAIADEIGGGVDVQITGGLVKSGGGMLTLSGANTYTGETLVSDGRLMVNGSISRDSSVIVAMGGTLGGTGIVYGDVEVLPGGTLAPGVSQGLLNTGSLSLSPISSLLMEINGTTAGSLYDQALVTGTVSLGGATLSLAGTYLPTLNETFVLIQNDGTDPVAGTFAGLPNNSSFTFNGRTMTIRYDGGTGNDVVLTATAGVPTAPDINLTGNGTSITDGDTTPSTTDHTDFGSQLVSSGTVVRTFTIQNTGAAALNVSGITAGGDFTVGGITLPASVPAAGSTTFTVTFDPSAVGTRTATVSIANDDADETPYTFAIQGMGTAPAPTVAISLSDTVIGIGDTPTVTFTFSEAVSGFSNDDVTSIPNGILSPVTTANGGHTFTATFTANASVEDATNVITTTNSGFASVATGLTGSGTSDSDNFTIDNVRPTLTSITVSDTALRIGETATVSFNFSEPTSPFVVPVSITTANGTLTGLTFTNGGATWNLTLTPTASVTDATNVISINLATVVDLALNPGTGTAYSPNYSIDTVRPTVSSIVLADSALTTGETSLLTITFSEAVTGFTTAGLTVPNGAIPTVSSADGGITWTGTFTPNGGINDATNVITVDLTGLTDVAGNAGTGSADSPNFSINTTTPGIKVQGSGTDIASGDTMPRTADGTDFGSQAVASGTITRTFTIQNTGTGALSLTGSPRVSISGTHAADFTVSAQPGSASIPAGNSLDFQITFDPAAPGLRSATVSIANNDSGASPYTFAIAGTGTQEVSIVTLNDAVVGGVNGAFNLTRTQSSGPLVVNFQLDASSTAVAGTDFTLSGVTTFDTGTGAGTVTFPDGVNSVTITLTALTESPDAAEVAETAQLNVVASAGDYGIGASASSTVTIAANGFVVTTTADSGSGSLRQAILNANAIAGTDTITFDPTTFATLQTITLATTLPQITSSLVISGTGATLLRVDGNDSVQVFSIASGAYSVTMKGLTLRRGLAAAGGAGLSNASTSPVTLVGMIFENNHAEVGSGGGGISHQASTLRLLNCLFVGNTADASSGGGVSCRNGGSVVEAVNCTFSGNTASFGAGIHAQGSGTTIQLINCTVTHNTLNSGGAINGNAGSTIILGNTLSAGNAGPQPDLRSAGTLTSLGNNLIGNATGITGLIGSDLTSTTASPLNAQLGALADNGGSTRTHALLAGSLAINAGNGALLPVDTFDLNGDTNTTEPIAFDQRGSGFPRAVGAVDIGAYEAAPAPDLNVKGNGIDIADGTPTPSSTDHTAFGSQAVSSGSIVRTFTVQNTGTADLTLGAGSITLSGTHAVDFAVGGISLPATLIPAGSTTFTVTFDPSAAGLRQATVSLASNDPDAENPYTFAIQGTGIAAPTLTGLTPSNGNILGGTAVTLTGTGFTGATAVTFNGAEATSVNVVDDTTIITLTPAGSAGPASVLVTTPAGTNVPNTAFTYTTSLEIIVHDGSHGLAPELADGQGTPVNFGSTAPNVASLRSFTVRNPGTADLTLSSITVPSGYVTDGTAVTLAPGTSYIFLVALKSATPGTYAGSITIQNDGLNPAFDFPVTGTVVAPGSAPIVNVGENVAVQGTTGSAVLGGPPGSTLFSFIGSPALNSSGVLASAVQIRHADASLHTGMMVGQPLVLIATDTQTAPSLPGVNHFNFGPPVINETGHIAFIGEVRGAGITKNVNSRCLFSNASDGTLKLVAQIGMTTTLGSNLKTVGNFSIGGDLVIFLGTLVDNSVVLFGWDANTGLRALMRNGQSLDANGVTKTVKSFSVLDNKDASSGHGKDISVAPTGESLVSISVTFTDNSSGVVVGSFDGTSDTGFGATYGASQQFADTYASPAVIPLARWNTFRSPGFDNTGSYYGFISQMVTNTLAGVTSINNVGIFVDTAPGNLTLQLRENDPATGTSGLVFSDFSDLVLGGGDYEFLVKGEVRGSGVIVNTNDKGLWAQHATNGLVLVAREGSEAPGVAGSTFFRLTQIALPGTAQPMFQASMTTGVGGVTTANDAGLWVINEANEVKLAVREGDVLDVAGTPRTVTAITALLNGTTTGGALGRRAFLADGQLTLLLTFSGGIQANAKVVVP
jgi:hypothetical protein